MTEPVELAKVHVGDVGTLYKAKLEDEDDDPLDPSLATVKELIFQPPQSAPVAKEANVVTEDGEFYLTYTAAAGFHTVPGRWKVQGHIVFSNGDEFHTTTDTFQVLPNLS